jgi:hypothetical protein
MQSACIGFLVGLHAFCSWYSFMKLFGLSMNHPDDQYPAQQALWSTVSAVTWFPLLRLYLYVSRGQVPPLAIAVSLTLLNSTVVVLTVWFTVRRLRNRLRCHEHQAA